MKIRISQLWKVPVFCVAAGYISFYIYVFFVSRFGVTVLPDGSYTTNKFLTMLLSLILLAATLAGGYLLFQKMTRSEIFTSASIIVGIHLILQLIQLLCQGSTLSFSIGMYFTYANEWCRIISEPFYLLTKNLWIGAFVVCFTPYLFVLLRKKDKGV